MFQLICYFNLFICIEGFYLSVKKKLFASPNLFGFLGKPFGLHKSLNTFQKIKQWVKIKQADKQQAEAPPLLNSSDPAATRPSSRQMDYYLKLAQPKKSFQNSTASSCRRL